MKSLRWGVLVVAVTTTTAWAIPYRPEAEPEPEPEPVVAEPEPTPTPTPVAPVREPEPVPVMVATGAYPRTVADRPLILPARMFDLAADLRFLFIEENDNNLDGTLLEMAGKIGLGSAEISAGADVIVYTPNDAEDRLYQLTLGGKVRVAPEMAIGLDLRWLAPTSDEITFLDNRLTFQIKRLVHPKFAAVGVGGFQHYGFYTEGDTDINIGSLVIGGEGQITLAPVWSLIIKMSLVIPLFDDIEGSGDPPTSTDFGVRGVFSATPKVDLFAEIGLSDELFFDSKRLTLGAAFHLP